MTSISTSPDSLPRRLAASGLYYGWWIAAAAVTIEVIVSGLFFNAYGAYVVLFRAEFGWSLTVLSLAFAVSRLESGLLAPLQGWLVDRYGARAIVNVGLVVLIAGYVLLSFVASIEALFVAILVMTLGASLGGFSSLAIVLVRWFDRRRSTALGLLSAAFAASSLLLPAVVLSLNLFGWRVTALLSALATAFVAVPVAQVLRRGPERHGLLPDGATVDGALATTGSQRSTPVTFTLRQAVGTARFWFLSMGHASAVALVSAVMVHLIPHLTNSLGYTLAQASGFAVILSILMAASSLVGGVAGDRFDRRALLVSCMGGHAIAILILAYATQPWMVGAFALLHGVAWGVRGPLMSAIRADYFGVASYGLITGTSQAIVMLGMVAGPLIAGIAFDLTGSYVPGFIAVAGIALVGAVFFVLASRPIPTAVAVR